MRKATLLLLFITLQACNYFKSEQKPNTLARVGEVYLYESEIAGLIPEGTSKKDSISIVKNYINRWATQKLLMSKAELNLSNENQKDFNVLLEQYKVDLYTRAYIEDIVQREVDTIVSKKELVEYYNENKENFKTTGSLVRLRYINLPKLHPKFELIKSKFYNKSSKDEKFWETYQMHFKSSALNDSIWVDMDQVFKKLPFITPDNRDDFIASGKSYQFPDTENVYLVKVSNVIDRNEVSPFDFIKGTLKEIIINKRKLDLIKKFEKEITEDAIKNNKYEIYK